LLNASHGISITHSDSHSFLKSLLISVALMHPPTLSRFLPPYFSFPTPSPSSPCLCNPPPQTLHLSMFQSVSVSSCLLRSATLNPSLVIVDASTVAHEEIQSCFKISRLTKWCNRPRQLSHVSNPHGHRHAASPCGILPPQPLLPSITALMIKPHPEEGRKQTLHYACSGAITTLLPKLLPAFCVYEPTS